MLPQARVCERGRNTEVKCPGRRERGHPGHPAFTRAAPRGVGFQGTPPPAVARGRHAGNIMQGRVC